MPPRCELSVQRAKEAFFDLVGCFFEMGCDQEILEKLAMVKRTMLPVVGSSRVAKSSLQPVRMNYISSSESGLLFIESHPSPTVCMFLGFKIPGGGCCSFEACCTHRHAHATPLVVREEF